MQTKYTLSTGYNRDVSALCNRNYQTIVIERSCPAKRPCNYRYNIQLDVSAMKAMTADIAVRFDHLCSALCRHVVCTGDQLRVDDIRVRFVI